jgi:hypothetical protein
LHTELTGVTHLCMDEGTKPGVGVYGQFSAVFILSPPCTGILLFGFFGE